MERIITSIKGPVNIAYNKFVNNLAKQEDTTSSALCQFTFSQSYPCIEYKKVKRNPMTNVEITDSVNERLNITSEKYSNENQHNIDKKGKLTFHLNSTEVEEYKKFVNKHKKCNCSATIGGKISIIFTPTGLGNAKSVKCNVCGEEKEITDVSNW